jgi:anthranilate synthase/aminodeoxychorismate synthase-like glutamine amidotransferase
MELHRYKSGMQIGFIDHYDSFSFNVIDWLREPGVEILYAAYDDADAMRRIATAGCPLVLSPGPGRPEDVGPTLALVKALRGKVPIFGICLGHQILGYLDGAEIKRSTAPFHGSARRILVDHAQGILHDMKPAFTAAVYHSLVVDRDSLPDCWKILAHDDLGEIQAMEWTPEPPLAPAFGVQFHPESFMSEDATPILLAWLKIAKQLYRYS